MDAPPLPKKKPAVFHHPLGFELYDALAMDLHAMTYAEPLLEEIERLQKHVRKDADAYWDARESLVERVEALHAENERLRVLIADIKVWDVSQYVAIPHKLRARIEAALPASAPLQGSAACGASPASGCSASAPEKGG